MPTTVTSTIGSTGDYSTLQSWEDACPSNLVTDDKIWRGECQNETFTAGVDISGITTDSTRYIELTTVAGASFMDNANASTNALRVNASNGAAVIGTTGGIAIRCGYTKISKLQFKRTDFNSAIYTPSTATSFTIENCIFEASGDYVGYYETAPGTHNLINCLFIHDTTSTNKIAHAFRNAGTFNVYNCTTVRPSNRSATGTAYWCDWVTLNIKNSAGFGFAVFGNGWNSAGAGYNASDVAITYGSNNQASLTYADQFEVTTTASSAHDFRLKTGSTLIDTATDLSASGVTTDIVGKSRSGSYDIGAWEFESVTPPSTRRRYYIIN